MYECMCSIVWCRYELHEVSNVRSAVVRKEENIKSKWS